MLQGLYAKALKSWGWAGWGLHNGKRLFPIFKKHDPLSTRTSLGTALLCAQSSFGMRLLSFKEYENYFRAHNKPYISLLAYWTGHAVMVVSPWWSCHNLKSGLQHQTKSWTCSPVGGREGTPETGPSPCGSASVHECQTQALEILQSFDGIGHHNPKPPHFFCM